MVDTAKAIPLSDLGLLGDNGAYAVTDEIWYTLGDGAKLITCHFAPESGTDADITCAVQVSSGGKGKNHPVTEVTKAGSDGDNMYDFETSASYIRGVVTAYGSAGSGSNIYISVGLLG